MSSPLTGPWAPDGAPSRRDVALTVLSTVWAVLGLATADSIARPWLAAGFLAFAAATGPLAATALGDRVGAWFRGIGRSGRAVAIVLFAATVWTAMAVLEVPLAPASSFAYGGMLGIAVVVAVESLRSRLAGSDANGANC